MVKTWTLSGRHVCRMVFVRYQMQIENVSPHGRPGMVPVAVWAGLPGIRSTRGALGHSWFGPLRVRRPLGLGRLTRLDRNRLLHRLRRLHQLRLVLQPAPAAQPAHVLRLSRTSHNHGHDQLPDGRTYPFAQSTHDDPVLWKRSSVIYVIIFHFADI